MEVESTDQVDAAAMRLADAGPATFAENDTDCCYAVQDQVCVHGPGQEPWEIYVVKGEGARLENGPADCCTGVGCTNEFCSTDSVRSAGARSRRLAYRPAAWAALR